MDTPKQVFEEIKKDASRVEGVKGIFQFKVTGDNGGDWYVDSTGDELVIEQKLHENPGCTFTCTDDDLVAMAKGEMASQMAFMMGKLKVEGDMMLAMQLQKVFG